MTTLPKNTQEGRSEGGKDRSGGPGLDPAPKDYDRIPELVRRAQADEQEAQEELLGCFNPLIRAVLRHYAGWPALDQDDLLGEVLGAFWCLVRQFDPARGVDFPGYMHKMLPATIHSYVRRQRAHQEPPLPPSASDAASFTTDCLLWEEQVVNRLCLREAISRLPARQQQALVLSFFCGYTQEEIAGKMRITRQKVGALLQRALQRLRKILEEN